MKKYIGTKELEAEPMNLGDYNLLRGWNVPEDEDPKREGYFVVYPDGYRSWSPKEVFESAYKLIELPFLLEDTVFPSDERTVCVMDDDVYSGAHLYLAKNSIGYKDGKAEYVESRQSIQFVKKNDDGTVIPGLQSEQLAIIMLDRCKKLNARFPSAQNKKMIAGLQMFLDACRERVQDRIDRGVMGDLKK